ncbi:clavesin-1 [Stomoxys calcitrans]|uniref:CRAL-TRIO domain-containing protein n=1 Tax=Stomoxys calcitrans TaxID=35570 RepID=A0A1I8P849_STOCA|nr:clavesin-1 [Stomoxys calcitrans]
MLQLMPLSAELQKVAIEELGEVPSRIPQDLENLKLWIKQQPHLRARTDDQFLIQFLRGCKYSLEKAKSKLEYALAVRTKFHEYFQFTDVDDVQFRRYHNTGAMMPLPTPLNGFGPRLIMARFTFSGKEFCSKDSVRYMSAMMEVLAISDPIAAINGFVFIMDFSQCTRDHMKDINATMMKLLISVKEKALPMRLKGFYVINLAPYQEQLVKLALTFMPTKLRRRIFICGKDVTTLGEHLPQKYLPQEYGGENGCIDELCLEFNQVWDQYREYFKENSKYGVDEHLRLGGSIFSDFGEFGAGGSFRKIEVD